MKIHVLTILLTFLLYACDTISKKKLMPADTLHQKDRPPLTKSDTISIEDTEKSLKTKDELYVPSQLNRDMEILISSGESSPYYTIKINGYEFDIVLREKDTIYLATSDKYFLTPEGYKIGTTLSDLPTHLQNNLIKEPGWGYYIQIKSGWTLGFCEGRSCTDSYPSANSEVKWIFKRK